jgi:hypothetical protein
VKKATMRWKRWILTREEAAKLRRRTWRRRRSTFERIKLRTLRYQPLAREGLQVSRRLHLKNLVTLPYLVVSSFPSPSCSKAKISMLSAWSLYLTTSSSNTLSELLSVLNGVTSNNISTYKPVWLSSPLHLNSSSFRSSGPWVTRKAVVPSI